MNIKQLAALMAIMYSSVSLNAQSGILKTIASGAKTSATNKIVETADKTVNTTLNKILDGNILKKKAGKADKAETVLSSEEQSNVSSHLPSATELTISHTDYSSIVALADVIKSNKNVRDVQRSFANGFGTIKVVHSCKTEELLDDLLKKTANYEVTELTNRKITLKTKK